MHLHGHSFKIIATDGNPVPPAAQLLKDTVLLGPGERYDLEINGTNPGIWMFHCHMPNHGDNGMMTALIYEGFSLPTDNDHHQGPPQAPAPANDHEQERSQTPAPAGAAQGVAAAAPANANRVTVSTVDDRYDPSALTVPVGSTVVWDNRGSNLHTATSFSGAWDTGTLQAGQQGAITFTEPGEYRYYCRQHLLGGMLGRIVVQ
jgi:FtsP/CotA-like multicopper oxidase with cupredoxin domain